MLFNEKQIKTEEKMKKKYNLKPRIKAKTKEILMDNSIAVTNILYDVEEEICKFEFKDITNNLCDIELLKLTAHLIKLRAEVRNMYNRQFEDI